MSTYFEDVVVGETVELGSTRFTPEAIVAFAREFDPQPFHLDDAAARQTLFGGLSASGWHTAAVWLRHTLDHRKRVADEMTYRGERPARYGPSPGFEKLKWLKPVRAGDTIRYTLRVIDKVESRSRPAVGLIVSEGQGFNQNGELVFTLVSKIFAERRVPGGATASPKAGD